jgi:hypothetical protein
VKTRTARATVPALLGLAAALSFAGCGGDCGSASGSVTLDGQPLREGLITFHPAGDGPTAYGQVNAGEFTLSTGQKSGLKVGKYQVTVSATTIPESGSGQPGRLLTPKKYASKETSGLEADVKSGGNRFKFEMRSKP